MPELLVDLITSLDGYAAAEGWPGRLGLQGPEYLRWLGAQPEPDFRILMGGTTYRVNSNPLRRGATKRNSGQGRGTARTKAGARGIAQAEVTARGRRCSGWCALRVR